MEENNYYDNKNVKTMGSFKSAIVLLFWILMGILLVKSPLYISLPILIGAIIYIFRDKLELNKNHKIHIKLDSYGSIQVFDNSTNLIAIIYKDRTIDYQRAISFWKMSKIKNISDHFEEYEFDLKVKEDNICL